jgi:hypothetical protein
MRRFYIVLAIAFGAAVAFSSCKKEEKEDCITVCGEKICEDEYNKEKDEDDLSWSDFKTMAPIAEAFCGME